MCSRPRRKSSFSRSTWSRRCPSRICATSTRSETGIFYHWIKIFFENGDAAFEANSTPKAQADAKDKKIELLEAKLVRKNEVVAELLEAHTTLKKSLGES